MSIKTPAKLSVGNYHRMIEPGILRDRYVELLARKILQMG